jgi:hypothetical protein
MMAVVVQGKMALLVCHTLYPRCIVVTCQRCI